MGGGGVLLGTAYLQDTGAKIIGFNQEGCKGFNYASKYRKWFDKCVRKTDTYDLDYFLDYCTYVKKCK